MIFNRNVLAVLQRQHCYYYVVRAARVQPQRREGVRSIWEGETLTLNWYLNAKTVCVCVGGAYRKCNSIEAYPFHLHIISDYAVRDDWLQGPIFSSIRPNYQTAPVAPDLNLLNYSTVLCCSQPKTFFNSQTSLFFKECVWVRVCACMDVRVIAGTTQPGI